MPNMSPVTVARGTMMDMLSIAREDAAARFDARQHTTESGDSSHVVISPRRQRRADALFVMGGRTEHRPALHTADRRWSAAHCVASDALPKRRRRRIPQSGSLSHHLDTVPTPPLRCASRDLRTWLIAWKNGCSFSGAMEYMVVTSTGPACGSGGTAPLGGG